VLSNQKKSMVFQLKAKCRFIVDHLSLEEGDMVFKAASM